LELHEACGQRPEAFAGLNVALAQENFELAILDDPRNCPNHIEGVFVMNGVAAGADGSGLGIAIIRDAKLGGGAAVAAVFDRGSGEHNAQCSGKEKAPGSKSVGL
jgi:hypothetical protein